MYPSIPESRVPIPYCPFIIDEPETVHRILSLTTDLCIMYAKEQENAGSDVIQIGEAACSGDLISGDDYGRYIAPCHKKLCAEIKIPTVVHICGNITSHLTHIKNTGMSGISMDIKTDIEQAVALLKGNTAIIGYVPVSQCQLKNYGVQRGNEEKGK